MRNLICLVSWVLVALTGSLAQPQEAEKPDLDRMQGNWVLEAMEANGQLVLPARLEGTTLTIQGDQYSVKFKERIQVMTVTLDPKKNPREIDMIPVAGPEKDKVHKGIYLLEGDRLKICRGLGPDQDRPRDLGTWPGTNCFLVTWKRLP